MSDQISKRIREARIERNLTQQELAEYLGRTAPSISDLERGKVQVSARDLKRIADYLGKPVEFFFGEEYLGDDTQALISLIRKMPPEIRSNQVAAISSMLLMQRTTDELMSIDDADEEAQKEHAKAVYNALGTYLIQITEMRDKALEVKSQLEEVLGISQ